MKKILPVFTLLLFLFGCVVVPPDHPAPEPDPGPGPAPSGFCDEYAQTAVDQSRENSSRGCGFSGARWSTNYNQHLNYCRSVSQSRAASERRARYDQLASCGSSGGSGSSSRCREYAREAVEQYRKNRSYGCGFSGARWHGDYNRHYNWCRSASVSQGRNERRARDDQLRSCRASGSGSGSTTTSYCRDYARKAVEQHQLNRSRGCGFSGARWHSDYNRHYNWCRSTTYDRAQSEKSTRIRKLNECRSSGGSGSGSTTTSYCRDYARKAVEQHQLNRSRGCGFSGARWHSDYNRHYNWCRSTTYDRAQSEKSTRIRKLNECRSSGGSGSGSTTTSYCRDYARKAVEQHQLNRSRGCGFSGARWHSDYNRHYNWCRSTTHDRAQSEKSTRIRKLNECRSSGGSGSGSTTTSYCRDYARKAVEQHQLNRSRGCGFSGARWHSDYNRHYNWCRSTTYDRAQSEKSTRIRKLNECRSSGGSGGGSGSSARCQSYARKAVEQQRENVRYSCGFSGGAWHLDYNRHYNWCRSASVSQSNNERRARREALRRCH